MSTPTIFALTAACAFLWQLPLKGHISALSRLPATLLHELSHYLVATITGSHPTSMNLVPRKQGGEWVMGSVGFCPGWLTAGFVALAPIGLLALSWVLWESAGDDSLWAQIGKGMLFSSALRGAWPSRTDWGVALRYPLGPVMAVIVGGCWLHVASTP